MISKINESINSIDNQNVLLLGGYNFRNIDWVTGQCSRDIEQTFMDTIHDNLLHQFIDTPTRGSNILDLAFVGCLSSINSFDILPPFGLSNHNIIEIIFS